MGVDREQHRLGRPGDRERGWIEYLRTLCPAEELKETVGELVGKLKEKSPAVLRLARKAIYSGFDLSFKEALANVTAIYLGSLMNTEDAAEGLRAFLEKRKPVWKGK